MRSTLAVILGVVISADGLAAPENYVAGGEPELLLALGSDDYAVRERAHAELLSLAKLYGQKRLSELAHTYFASNDPELQSRLYAILKVCRQARAKPVLGLSFKEEELKLKDGTHVIAMFVRRLSRGKSAQKAGLMVGDRIVRIGSQEAKSDGKPYVVKQAVASLQVGKKVPFHILREGKALALLVRIEGAPVDDSDEARREKEEQFAEWLESQNSAR
ncbi:hypothetical protein JIN77_06010 [Verrucomicrobiaceae bacterium R5-34]|nr:hypothetical protein [Verrucomicrobiaceae bacterium R5-34]